MIVLVVTMYEIIDILCWTVVASLTFYLKKKSWSRNLILYQNFRNKKLLRYRNIYIYIFKKHTKTKKNILHWCGWSHHEWVSIHTYVNIFWWSQFGILLISWMQYYYSFKYTVENVFLSWFKGYFCSFTGWSRMTVL